MANFQTLSKRVTPITGALLAILLLSGCNKSEPEANDRLLVVTTFPVIADMASKEIHNYQPTPQDIVRTDKADLVLWNGLGLELWFEKFLEQLGDVPSVVVTEGIEPIDIHQGPYTGKPNPHAWMSTSDALIYVDNIATAMAKADSANEKTYLANAQSYKQEIKELSAPLKEKMQSIPEPHRWLVSSEGAFSYLARDFGLKELYL